MFGESRCRSNSSQVHRSWSRDRSRKPCSWRQPSRLAYSEMVRKNVAACSWRDVLQLGNVKTHLCSAPELNFRQETSPSTSKILAVSAISCREKINLSQQDVTLKKRIHLATTKLIFRDITLRNSPYSTRIYFAMTAVRFKMQEFLSLPQKRKFGGDFTDRLGECYRLKYTGQLTRACYHGSTQWRLAARSLYAKLVLKGLLVCGLALTPRVAKS